MVQAFDSATFRELIVYIARRLGPRLRWAA